MNTDVWVWEVKGYKLEWRGKWRLNLLTPRSDWNLTSPFNIQYIMQQTGNENTQTYQVDIVVLIKYQILITNLQGSLQQL